MARDATARFYSHARNSMIGFFYLFDGSFGLSSTMRLAVAQGWIVVEVEGDALAIIKKCKSNIKDFSQVSPQIVDIHQTKCRFQSVEFLHVPKEANHLAHVLATETLKRREEFYLDNGIPNFAEDAWLMERDWEPD